MHKNLSKFVGCLCALGFSGFCLAGEGAAQHVMVAPMVLAQVQHAKAVEASPTTIATPALTPTPVVGLAGEGGDDYTLATVLLGLGLLATVVYRAKAA